ncbi:MAG: cupin domain-containing protein [Thermoleophilaceae bacterium]
MSAAYTILRPANRYASRLPNLRDALLYKLVTPRHAPARFGEYLVAMEAGGGTSAPVAAGFEDFLYGLEGELTVGADGIEFGLRAGGWCYLPPDMAFELEAGGRPAELLWIKRRLEAWPGLDAPEARAGHRDDEPFDDTDVQGLRRRELLDPADARLDFNMSLLAFDAGVGLAQTEIHDEEHGLFMTAGGGRYHLDGTEHDVDAGDFIYMAPYCPQSFTAGDEPAEYLLYKDVYRDGF